LLAALLADGRSLADPVAKEVESRAPRMAMAQELDLLDTR
jgi:hypothetical protein